MARTCGDRQRGQATVEFVAVLPLVVLVAAALWQAVLLGWAAWSAGGAARAAARAAAIGADVPAAARAALPAGLRRGVRAAADDDGRVRVAVRVPAVVGGLRMGRVRAVARFEAQR